MWLSLGVCLIVWLGCKILLWWVDDDDEDEFI